MEKNHFSAPFLRKVTFNVPLDGKEHPFDMPLFSKPFEIEFTTPITLFVGENGSGKSTILEAIASGCGFSLTGGNRNHVRDAAANHSPLTSVTKLSWLPKITRGFFMRAESFFDFASEIDAIAEDDKSVLLSYGNKSLHEQSHGESFLSLFQNHFGENGLYILDEPEAALSPTRQLSLLTIMNRLEKEAGSQMIIATHSPILLSYPGARILSLENGKLKEVTYHETEHYALTKNFLENPERYFKHLFQ